MHLRRMRPVAALTLALVSLPFAAAAAVAAQAEPAGAADARVAVAWPGIANESIQHAVALAVKAAETVAPPADTPPPAAVRATPPPPPPPPSVDDPATWIYPANGPITSPYGRRWGRMHEGVDIDAAYGSAVVAAHRGTVIAAGWGQSGYGRVVHIDHGNGMVTTYNHLAEVHATVGQVVEQGTQVGLVGASGSVTAAHLHYEVRINGGAVNPTPWLTGAHSTAGNPG